MHRRAHQVHLADLRRLPEVVRVTRQTDTERVVVVVADVDVLLRSDPDPQLDPVVRQLLLGDAVAGPAGVLPLRLDLDVAHVVAGQCALGHVDRDRDELRRADREAV